MPAEDPIVLDLKRLGAPDSVIAETISQAPPTIEIWPENREAFVVFCRMATQWHFAPGLKAERVGLKYEALEPIMRLLEIKNTMEVFDGVQTMEFAALDYFRTED